MTSRKVKVVLVREQVVLKSVRGVPVTRNIQLFSIACLSYVKEYASNDSFVLCANVVCVLSFFSLLLLVVFWIYIKHSNERLMQHIAVEQKLKELQKKYYNTLLAKDEDTRKFRHDINNHLICLHALANKTQQPSIINYIEEVQQGLLKIQKGSYDTGNDIIDAFLNYEAQKRRNRVEIKIIGTCTNKVTISDVDMCIIFSNLLSNAFEELDRIEFENNQKPQKLFVSLSQNDNCFRCQIKNTKRDIERKRIKSLRSEKNDNVNHGFGLENVREAVQRNKGLFNVLIDKEWYVCSIIFKT